MKKNIVMAGMSFLVVAISLIFVATAYAQNATGSMDVESVKSLLDQAKGAMDSGDKAKALMLLDQAEDKLDIAEDSLQQSLGIQD